MSERLQEVLSELDDVRAALRAKTSRLGEAEEALSYYADPNSYKPVRDEIVGQVNQNHLVRDSEPVGNTNAHTFVAGRRAREYFEKFRSQV